MIYRPISNGTTTTLATKRELTKAPVIGTTSTTLLINVPTKDGITEKSKIPTEPTDTRAAIIRSTKDETRSTGTKVHGLTSTRTTVPIKKQLGKNNTEYCKVDLDNKVFIIIYRYQIEDYECDI